MVTILVVLITFCHLFNVATLLDIGDNDKEDKIVYSIQEDATKTSELIRISFNKPVCMSGFHLWSDTFAIKTLKIKCEPENHNWKFVDVQQSDNNSFSNYIFIEPTVVTHMIVNRRTDEENLEKFPNKKSLLFDPVYCPGQNSQSYCGRKRTILTQEILNEKFFGTTTGRRVKREIGGVMTANSVLSANQSPYEIVTDILVPEGTVLVVEPGVRMHFAVTAGLTVKGQIHAQGTSSLPIMMLGTTNFTRWKGLLFVNVYKKYAVDIVEGRYANEGFVNVQSDGSWHVVCSDNWNDTNANVACKEMGFGQASVSSSSFVRPLANYSGSFWPYVAHCYGTERQLSDCEIVSATTTCKSTAAVLQCIGSAQLVANQTALSTLDYVNVSNAVDGIVVNGVVPVLNYVTVINSVSSGLTVTTRYSPSAANPTLRKCQFVNNKGYGIHLRLFYPPEEKSVAFDIDESLVTAGGDAGLRLEGHGRVRVRKSAFFSNGLTGVESFLTSGSVEIRDSISASNGRFAMMFVRLSPKDSEETLKISIVSSNITGHWYNSAVVVNTTKNSDVNFENVLFWDNYNGVLTFGPLKNSDVRISSTNFTRNRGEILKFFDVGEQNKIVIDRNRFNLNLISQHVPYQSIVDIRYRDEIPTLTTTEITNNEFQKNTMHRMINVEPTVRRLDDEDDRAAVEMTRNFETLISKNNVRDNLVPDTVYMETMKANISYNNFNNPVSDCELKMGPYHKGSRIFAMNNFWGTSVSEGVTKKVCDYARNNRLMPAEYQPYSNVEVSFANRSIQLEPLQTKPSNEDELGGNVKKESMAFTARNNPYIINASLQIGIGSTLTIEPGVVVEFELDKGLVIFGQVIAIGTAENPIVFRSSKGQVWRGIYFENEASPISTLEFCIIDSPQHGVYMNSDRVNIKNCLISNTLLTGITIADTIGTLMDFGLSRIVNSQDIGLRVINRHYSVEIRNLIVENTGGNGIDFENPTMNITLNNIRMSNSRRYAIHVDQTMSSHQSVDVVDCLITNQRGVGGIYLSGRNYRLVTVANSVFLNNSASSLIAKLKCNYSNDYSSVAPPFTLWNNTFESNTDVVVDIDLMYCTNANISRNQFFRNNQDRRNGVLRLEMEPVEDYGKESFRIVFNGNVFDQNAGDYTVYLLAMNIDEFVGSVTYNRFTNNENRRSVLILGSPLFVVRNNLFSNARSRYYIEAEYNDNRKMDATNNYWGTNVDKEILATIFDGTKITTRGIIIYQPYLYGWNGGNGSGNGTNGTNLTRPSCVRLNSCNNRGQCIADDVCQCESGYSGLSDCSRFSCEQRSNCNNNGWCSGPNICTCYNGFSGFDCRAATCFQVNNCSGHGQCVSLDECLCATGYTGSDCNTPTSGGGCIGNCNGRGACITPANICQCYEGWVGRNCELANCSQVDDCSGHGACSGPNLCNCFAGYSGIRCNQVAGNCNTICIHGICNTATKNCVCQSGWTGDDCARCENGGNPENLCQTTNAKITYIVPTSISTGPNSRIYIYGENFDRNYVCKFGNQSITAYWVNANYIQCAVPTSLSVDKINFTITDNNGKAVQVSNTTNVTVSFYSSCSTLKCNVDQSTCFHGTCLCFDGFFGQTCTERTTTIPIDFNQTESNPKENEPFKINFKLKNDSVQAKWVLVEGPSNISVNPITGELVWLKPIGSVDPIKITVSAITPQGVSSITMEKVVMPTYYPSIDSSYKTNQNLVILNGSIHTIDNATILNSNNPVKVLIYRNGKLYGELSTESNEQNRFTVTFVPDYQDGGNYVAVAVHPGNVKNANTLLQSYNTTANWTIQSLMSVPDNINIPYSHVTNAVKFNVLLTNTGDRSIRGFQLKMKNNVSQLLKFNVTYQQNGATVDDNFELTPNNSLTAIVELRNLDGYNGPLLFQFTTNSDGITSDWLINVAATDFDKPWLIVEPSLLNISTVINSPDSIYKVSITNKGQKSASQINVQYPLETPLYIIYAVKGNTFYNVSPNSGLILAPNETLTIAFGVLSGNVPLIGFMNGSLNLTTAEGSTIVINYQMKHANNDAFDSVITFLAKSENPLSLVLEPINGVLVDLKNPISGFKQSKTSAANGQVLFSNISEGYYQLTTSKAEYENFNGAFYLSSNNGRLQITLLKHVQGSSFILVESNQAGGYILTFSNISEVGKNSIPYLKPIELDLQLNNITNTTKSIDFISVGNSSIDLLPFMLNANIPAVVEKKDLLTLPNNSIAKAVIKIGQNLNFHWNNSLGCDAYVIHPVYNYTIENTSFQSSMDILLRNTNYRNRDILICNVGADNAISVIPVSTKQYIYCDCRQAMQTKCTANYEPLSVCSNQQFSDNAGLELVIQLMDWINTCSVTLVNLENDAEALKCILDISDVCLNGENVLKFQTKRDSGKKKLFEQLSLSQSVVAVDNVHSMNSLFPVLFELANSPKADEIMQAFSQFFDLVKQLLNFSRLDVIMGTWYSKFKKAIADNSPGGELITENEFKNVLEAFGTNSAQSTLDKLDLVFENWKLGNFLIRWNETIKAWSQGNIFPKSNEFMSFPLVASLANNTAFLKKVALEVHIPYFLENNPRVVFLDQFFVRVVFDGGLISRKYNKPKTTPDTQTVASNQTTTVQWTVSPTNAGKLNRSYQFRCSILLTFRYIGNAEEMTRLYSRTFTVKPKPSLKVFYFIQPSIPKQWETGEPNPYNVLLILMNTGYSVLNNVQLKQPRVKAVDPDNESKSVSYILQKVVVGKNDSQYDLEPEIVKIDPGQVVVVRYGFVSPTKANITDFDQSILVDGNIVTDFEVERFFVLKFFELLESASGTPVIPNVLVSKKNELNSTFVYNSKTTMLHPVDTSQLVATYPDTIIINGKKYHTMQFQIRKDKAGSPGVHGQFELPFALNDSLQLLTANRTNYLTGNRTNYTLPNSAIWVVNQPGRFPVLNFVDTSSPENEIILNYNFIFGEPNKNGPQFVKVQNSVVIPADSKQGYSVTDVQATDADQENITYSLFGGDGLFAINEETGKIIQQSDIPLNKAKFCILVRASDNGVPQRSVVAPVEILVKDAVDYNGQQCEIYNDLEERPNYIIQDTHMSTTGYISVVQTERLSPVTSVSTLSNYTSSTGSLLSYSSSNTGSSANFTSSTGYISVIQTQQQNVQSSLENSNVISSLMSSISSSTTTATISTDLEVSSIISSSTSTSTSILTSSTTQQVSILSTSETATLNTETSTWSSTTATSTTTPIGPSQLTGSLTESNHSTEKLVVSLSTISSLVSENLPPENLTSSTSVGVLALSNSTVSSEATTEVVSIEIITEVFSSEITTGIGFPTLGLFPVVELMNMSSTEPTNTTSSTSTDTTVTTASSTSSTTTTEFKEVTNELSTEPITEDRGFNTTEALFPTVPEWTGTEVTRESSNLNANSSVTPAVLEQNSSSSLQALGQTTSNVLETLSTSTSLSQELNLSTTLTPGLISSKSVNQELGSSATTAGHQDNVTNLIVDQNIDQNSSNNGIKISEGLNTVSPDDTLHDEDYDKLVAVACKTGQGKPILGVVCQLGKGTIKNPRFRRLLDSP